VTRRTVSISASFAGRCGSCNEPFQSGDRVAYNDDDVLVGQSCCPDVDEVVTGSGGSESVDLSLVMPRGKSVRDRCDQCFQIPSTSGACGCAS
jgi:hypothetical protein